jgi:hypothetical protein
LSFSCSGKDFENQFNFEALHPKVL